MNKSSLDQARVALVEAIEELGFGRIEHIPIRDVRPYIDEAKEVVHEFKLGSEPQRFVGRSGDSITLKIEFGRLFHQLVQLHDGHVDVDVWHDLPFRLFVKRCLGGRLA